MNFLQSYERRLTALLGRAQQDEDEALHFDVLVMEDLGGAIATHRQVALGEAEQAQDLLGGGTATLTLLGVVGSASMPSRFIAPA